MHHCTTTTSRRSPGTFTNPLQHGGRAVLALLLTFHVCAAEDVDFNRDIRPILNDRCAVCHGGVKKNAGFSVLSRQLLLTPADSEQPPVIPGDPDGSLLMRRIAADDSDERMPPEGKPLTSREIEALRRWIAQGAEWPEHWSYAPLASVPAIARNGKQDGNAHPVDQFILARLSEKGIDPSGPADRHTLIRRLFLDLTGLLPTPEEVSRFVDDQSPAAWDLLVTHLLSSPHFGERWARHWLDEARYADSEGYEKDSVKADAFRFRDWVINAINDDLPFDQFTIKQIAGDLLPDRTSDDLIATKFHLQTQFNLEGGVDGEEDRTKRTIDRVNTVASVWLSTSIGCCQCHDHPYDAFVRRDYYSMYAFFNNADFAADFLSEAPQDAETTRQERTRKWTELAATLKQQVSDKNLNNNAQAALSRLRQYDNSKGFTRYLQERTQDRRKTWMFERGDFLRPLIDEGEIVPNTPNTLPGLKPRGDVADRLDLAEWLVGDENPLTPRVTVNKVWMHLFGQPLVAGPDDFGSRGALPTHPELLDWLSYWFVHEADWSRKQLIRLIVTSRTYRQSAALRLELQKVDPDNRLLARQNRFRVEAEILRDIALQVAGRLSDKVGGPSVFPPLPAIIAQQTYAGSFKYKVSEGEDRYRRGLYTFFRRTAIDPNLTTFDCPDSSMSKPRRDRSNNALQALAILQNEVFHEAAQSFAKRLLSRDTNGETTDHDRWRTAFAITINRPPHDDEFAPLDRLLANARTWYARHPDDAEQLIGNYAVDAVSPAENAAWIAAGRVILNLDEFLTRN